MRTYPGGEDRISRRVANRWLHNAHWIFDWKGHLDMRGESIRRNREATLRQPATLFSTPRTFHLLLGQTPGIMIMMPTLGAQTEHSLFSPSSTVYHSHGGN